MKGKKKLRVLSFNNYKLKDNVVLVWGRFNPPSKFHKFMFDEAKKLAGKNSSFIIATSHSNDEKNPLTYEEKIELLKKYDENAVLETNARTLGELFAVLGKMGCKKVIMVCGSDREDNYSKLKAKDFGMEEIVVKTVGVERDEKSDGLAGMSGTKLRKYAKENKYNKFKEMFMFDDFAKETFEKIRGFYK